MSQLRVAVVLYERAKATPDFVRRAVELGPSARRDPGVLGAARLVLATQNGGGPTMSMPPWRRPLSAIRAKSVSRVEPSRGSLAPR